MSMRRFWAGSLPVFCVGMWLGAGLTVAAQVSLAGEAQISIGNAQVTEGDSGTIPLDFTVIRSGDSSSNIVIEYNTEEGLVEPATPGTDYIAQPEKSILRIPAGGTSGTISVSVSGDTDVEADEDLLVQLAQAVAFNPLPDFGIPMFNTGNRPHSVAAGDLDGDGKPDLVVANQDDNTISVLLNTTASGPPSFAGRVNFNVGLSPRSVAIGDLDDDGRPDLAVSNYDTQTVSVLINTSTAGTPSFVSGGAYFAGRPYAMAIGDIDGDDKPDLIAVNRQFGLVNVLRNLSFPGAPNFAAAQGFFLAGSGPASVAVGDVDGDGKADVVVANYDSHNVSVLRNTATEGVIDNTSFAAAVTFAVGANPHAIALGDVNGDGRLDMAAANSGSNPATVSVLRNTSSPGDINSGSFAAKVDFATGPNPNSVALSDIDGDSRPDLVVANKGRHTVSVLRNTTTTESPAFASQAVFSVGSAPFALVTGSAGDFTGDDKPDLAVVSYDSNSGSVLRNVSTPGTIGFAAAEVLDAGVAPHSVAAGDLDGDDKPDLVVVNQNNNNVSVLLNATTNGAPGFAERVNFNVGLSPRSVAIDDLDGDGKPDLVVSNYDSHYLTVLRNTSAPGSPSFVNYNTPGVGFPYAVVTGDIDGDDRPDLVVASRAAASGCVFRNLSVAGTPNFATAQCVLSGSGPAAVAVGDLDGDGKADVVVANHDSNNVAVMRNMTTEGVIDSNSFATPVHFTVGANPNSVVLGDVDGDGKPDLIVANKGSGTVSVLRNSSTGGAINSGSFTRVDFLVGAGPNAVAVEDVNGDGKPDVVVANHGQNTISTLINTTVASTPAFATQAVSAAGNGPFALAMGNLYGDDRPDVAVANFDGDDVSVFRNSPGFTASFANNEAVGTILDDDDTMPNSFSFLDQAGVMVNTVRESNEITVSGINAVVAVSVSGGEYSKNDGAYTSSDSTAVNGDRFKVRHTSSVDFSGSVDTTLTIGGVFDVFTSTTMAEDVTPDAFDLGGPTAGAGLDTHQSSASPTITGINSASPVSVTGGFYRINGGACIHTAGFVNNGDTVQVCHVSANTYLTQRDTTLTIGANGVLAGVSDTYSSITRSSAGLDTTPSAFKFTDRSNVSLGIELVSNAVTITGINAPAPVSVSGDSSSRYSIGCNGNFTANAGTIGNGQRVCVRHTSAGTQAGVVNTTLTIGGASGTVSDTFSSTTATTTDATPSAFRFSDKTNVPLSTMITSNVITPSGYNTGVIISVAGGEYSVGCNGNFTVDAGTLYPGQRVCVRNISSGDPGTTHDTILTVGGVADSFSITTVTTPDTAPTAFSFTDKTNAPLSEVTQSNTVTINGINTAAPIALVGGSDASSEYSIGCNGSFTNTPGQILPGQKVCVRHASAATEGTRIDTVLDIGGISDAFSTTTVASADTIPNAFRFSDKTGAGYGVAVTSSALAISGINTAAPIALGAGSDTSSEYSIGCNGSFTNTPGQILPGQKVCVRHVSSTAPGGVIDTILDIGGVTDAYTSTTTTAAFDDTPNAFRFSDRVNATYSTPLTSNSITVSGINTGVSISIDGGEYSIGCKTGFTANPGMVISGDRVCVRHTSAATAGSMTETTLTVGSVSDTFTSTTTTNAKDTTPNAFRFSDRTNVGYGVVLKSNTVTIGGINAPTEMSISGGEYSLGCTTVFATGNTSIDPGQKVCVRHTSANSPGTWTDTILTVGGVSDTYSTTTTHKPADTAP